MLKRIVSEIDIQDVTFDPPAKTEVTRALEELEAHKQSQSARLKVSLSSAAWFHFDLAPSQEVFEISFMDMYLFAEELMEFADEVEVLEPKELADLISSVLQKVSDDHA